MTFTLKIGVPYRTTARHRHAPADIQDFRQNMRWNQRTPFFGRATTYAASSMFVFALGMSASSLRLHEALQASAYDMTPTGSIQKVAPDKAQKAQSCNEASQPSQPSAVIRF